MTLGSGGHGASSRSNSRNNYRSGKYSTSRMKLTGGGSSIAGTGGSHPLGGHPLKSADQSKRQDIKHRFEITKKLGSGTYGKVSLAYDHKTERDVAVKLIKKSAIENKADLVRIRREIRIMSALQHPNIIQIYEVFENKDKIILVMEYACGGELYDYVSKNGSLPEHEARRIFRQITSAVLYCHKHKVAHRDLKLENILLDTDNNAKIADFGLSNYFDDKRLLTTFCGSPLYASPEIINGTPYKGPEVDCWSLGILLYTLVYGSMPFDGRDFNRMVRQIKRGAYYEPDTPSTASMLIRNMLRVNPDRRADIDDIASHWWLNLEENMPVIQELPENQITDHTPLTEREETMVVQDLADETDVFMEFGHLSSETRKKIEEFRRRRKEAEEYNENSPIKPPKAKKLNGNEEPEMTSKEKSLREAETVAEEKVENEVKIEEKVVKERSPTVKLDDLLDPLERLRQLENRLNTNRTIGSPEKTPRKDSRSKEEKIQKEEDSNIPTNKAPAFTSVTEVQEQKKIESRGNSFNKPSSNTKTSIGRARDWSHQETDSLNMLMNQVLEQMERGPVSLNTVARIKAHPHYDQRPMVKELLESILAAQPPSVQKQASKIIQQQSQDIVRKQMSGNTMSSTIKSKDTLNDFSSTSSRKIVNAPLPPDTSLIPNRPNPFVNDGSDGKSSSKPSSKNNSEKHKLGSGNRPWHSVEVGFESDNGEEEGSESECESEKEKGTGNSIKKKVTNDITEITVQDTSFEDVTDDETQASEVTLHTEKTPESRMITVPEAINEGSETDHASDLEDEMDEEYDEHDGEDEEEELDSEIEELADVVEQTVSSASNDKDINITINANDFLKNQYNIGSNTTNTTILLKDPQKTVPYSTTNRSLDESGFKAPVKDSNYLNTFDRGLIKRQSKGKYQLNHVDLYGRGVSTDSETPSMLQQKRRIGGPQPPVEQCPILFDKVSIQCPKEEYSSKYPINNMNRRETAISSLKQEMESVKKSNNKAINRTNEIVKIDAPATTFTAKKYIMQYPNKLEDSDDEKLNEKLIREKRQQSVKVQNTQNMDSKNGTQNRVSSLPPRSPPPVKLDDDDSEYENQKSKENLIDEEDESEVEEEDEEESEESDDDFNTSYGQASSILGFKANDSNGFTNPVIHVNNQPTSYKSPSLNKNNSKIQNKPYTSPAQNSKKNSDKKDGNINNARNIKKYMSNAVSHNNKECEDNASKHTTPASKNSSSSPSGGNDDYNGMQKWETAAAYIRRKNRERRQRNQTIAITEEAYLRAKATFGQRGNDHIESSEDSIPNSPSHVNPTMYNCDVSLGNGDSGIRYGMGNINLNKPVSSGYNYQHGSGYSGYSGNSSPYNAKRLEDYHYTPGGIAYGGGGQFTHSPQYGGYRDHYKTNRGIDRRKSFHELTPERDYNDEQFGNNFGFDKYRYNPNIPYQSSNTNPKHYEDEFSSSYWNNDGKRYQSYQIRNDSDMRGFGGSNIRSIGNNWANNSAYPPYSYERDRPVSNYGASGIGGYRSTRHEDNYNYPRRSAYDNDIKTGHGGYDYSNSTSSPYTPHQQSNISSNYGSKNETEERPTAKEGLFSRFRPVTKRVASVLGDKKSRPRSQSNDRKYSASGRSTEELHEFTRLTTPELSDRSSEYPYINYHDSATGGLPRTVIPKEPDINMTPTRGILKNKPSGESESRKDSNSSTGGGATSGVKYMLSRIRRRISSDKSVSPAPISRVSAPITYQNAFIGNVGTPFDEERRSHNFEVYDLETAARKRQLSNINRRRTCDIRMGPDGKYITNSGFGGTDEDYKRPRSPIEKIKSFFRKTPKETIIGSSNITSGGAGKSSQYDYSGGYGRHDANSSIGSASSSRYTTGTDKIFGSFPTSSNSSRLTSHGSSQYNSQANKYNPSPYASGNSSTRYTPSNRNWHDDPHHY
uniref:Protein kinase domain-containing protein n=1 Tax=Parastrongyloides trichosuri TaxID=131310 RepID=A0A0N4ZC60_PARTI